MSASIFSNRYAGQKPAWHHLAAGPDAIWGTDVRKTASEAVQLANSDYQVHSCPVWTVYNGKKIQLVDHRALVREATKDSPKPVIFGVVNKDYTTIQNKRIAEILDPLSREYPTVTVGSLDEGQRFFITFSAGSYEIAGEQIDDYFIFTDTKDGTGMLQGFNAPTRVVCQNTLKIALGQASNAIALRHTKSIEGDLATAELVLRNLKSSRQVLKEKLQALANLRLVQDQVDEIVAKVFVTPERPKRTEMLATAVSNIQSGLVSTTERDIEISRQYNVAEHAFDIAKARIASQRTDVLESYARINDEFPTIAGTGYAALNAFTESAQYRVGRGDQKARAASSLFGVRSKEPSAAFSHLTALLP